MEYKIKHKNGTTILEDVGGGVSMDDLIDVFLEEHDSWSDAIYSNFYDYNSDFHEYGPISSVDTLLLKDGKEKEISVSVSAKPHSKSFIERESLGWEVFFSHAVSCEIGEYSFKPFELEHEFNVKYLEGDRSIDSDEIISMYIYDNTETDEYVDIEGELIKSRSKGVEITLYINTKEGVVECDDFYDWREEMGEKGIDASLKEEVKKYLIEKYNIDN